MLNPCLNQKIFSNNVNRYFFCNATSVWACHALGAPSSIIRALSDPLDPKEACKSLSNLSHRAKHIPFPPDSLQSAHWPLAAHRLIPSFFPFCKILFCAIRTTTTPWMQVLPASSPSFGRLPGMAEVPAAPGRSLTAAGPKAAVPLPWTQ